MLYLNIRFNGDFDLEQFAHKAFLMVPNRDAPVQFTNSTVVLQALNFKVSLAAGETIREISRKFHLPTLFCHRVPRTSTSADWTDPQNWFALLLLSDE